MTVRDLYVGDAIQWELKDVRGDGARMRYGVVLDISPDNKKAIIASVFEDDGIRKCYDEEGHSDYDCNNVRLKHVPPPFHTICRFDQEVKPIGMHNPQRPVFIDDKFLATKKVDFEDVQRRRLSQRDLAELLHHPGPEQKELEVTRKTLQSIQNTMHVVKSVDYGASQTVPAKSKKLPSVGPKTVQAETAPTTPKPLSKTLKPVFSKAEQDASMQSSKGRFVQAKSKSWESDRPIGSLANLWENLGMSEDDGPDLEL